MIDWDSPKWGNTVHESETGSWLDGEGTSRRVLRGSGSFVATLPDWRDSKTGDPS